MIKNFVQLQPATWQKLYNQYTKLKASQLPSEEILAIITENLAKTFHSEIAAKIAEKVITSFETVDFPLNFFEVSPVPDENGNIQYMEPPAQLTLQDIKILENKLKDEQDPNIAKLLVSLLIYQRSNPHPSNWIKYDRKVIMFLSSLSKKRVSEQTLLTNRLHNEYNVDMRVVGSSQPIPCFKIPWCVEEDPVNSPENPLVDIGVVNPETIDTFVRESLGFEEKIKRNKQEKSKR